MAIPRILHQTYFAGWASIPEATKESIFRMQARNPGWEYRFYDQAAAEGYIADHFGREMLEIYLKINPEYYSARADLLRYLVCFREGGVYLDIKSSALEPMDNVLLRDDEFLLSQWAELRHLPEGKTRTPELSHIAGDEYVQWFIASAPGHPFLSAVIDSVVTNIEDYSALKDGVGKRAVLRLSGPIAYSLAIHPLRNAHPNRYVEFEKDLGLVFSIHGDHKRHWKVYGPHYSELTTPIVQSGLFATLVSRAWFGGVKPALQFSDRKLKGLRKRIGNPTRS